MLKISRELDLALLLMGELQLKKSTSLSEWAEEKKLPYRFLSKIAGKLKKAKLIKSREGREGGYWLNKKISVGQIIKAIDGDKGMVACLRGEKCQAIKFCKQRKILVKLNQIIEKQLNQMSLESLCH
jgi:Rrf2 family protein